MVVVNVVGVVMMVVVGTVAVERHNRLVVCHDVRLRDRELEVEDLEELALDTAHVALAEHAGAQRPVDVL